MVDNKKLESLQKRIAEAHVQATESALDLFGVFDFPGVPRDIYGDVDGLQPVPPGGIPPYYWNNRGRGEVLPVYTTWLQLKYIRDRSRRLCRENEFAICATENRKNYIVGDGFSYRATGRVDELNDAAQELIDNWSTAIELSEYELDGMERLDMDGEFFLRLFYRDSGLLELRFVEPEHIKDVAGEPWSPAESFGILTNIDDVENIIGYQVIEQPWINDTPTLVPAEEIIHVKLNVPRNAKRGLPTFYPVESNLRRANDLLASMAALAKNRAKIALIRKLLNATGSAAANMVNSLKVATVTDSMTNASLNIEKLPYGSVLTSTGNVEYDMPGANVDAGGFVEVLQAELRGIASRLCMPEWMLTSNSDATNYNQAFVSESHAVKEFRKIQRKLCRRFGESRHMRNKSVVWRQVEYAVQKGFLDAATLQEVKIQCEGPSLVAREKGQEAETNKVYFEMGLKSKSTISQELGLDRKQELDNIAKESQARVENANAGAPAAVRQQESVREREPGELDQEGSAYEPEQEPDLNKYIYNKFKGRYGEQDEPNKETGYIIRSGAPVRMGDSGIREADHREAIPSRAARERWGWNRTDDPEDQGNKIVAGETVSNWRNTDKADPFNIDSLDTLLRKSGVVRSHISKGHASFEYAQPLSTAQKRTISNYVLMHKPDEVVFSRRTPDRTSIGSAAFHHKILPWHEVENYLDGTQESVKRVTETKDQQGASHSPTHGQYVQPEFGPEYPMLMDPKAKQEYIARKTLALQQDYMQAAQAHAENLNKLQQAAYIPEGGQAPQPEELDKLNAEVQKSMQNVRKAWDAFQTSNEESKQLASGPMKPDLGFLDRTLTSGPFHIISAGKNSNHPDHKDVAPEEFAERHKQLGDDLSNAGYKYMELKGKYGGLEEPSYLVVAPEDHAHVIRTLGYKYGQESVIHSAKGQNQLAFVTGPGSNTHHKGSGFGYLPDAEDNYSEYDSGNGKAKFALNFDFNNTHETESVKEAIAPQSGLSGFNTKDFRDMLHSYLPPKNNTEETHDPVEVARFYHDLSNTLKARTGKTLPEVLSNHKLGDLHKNAGEAVVNALVGGPMVGGHAPWDTEKVNSSGVPLAINTKMIASSDPTQQRHKQGAIQREKQARDAAGAGRFPINIGLNPSGMILAHKGTNTFTARDTADTRQRVAKGDAAVLHSGTIEDFLKDPGAIASAQEQWKQLADSVKTKHLSNAIDDTQHKVAVSYFRHLQSLSGRGDKTAAKKLKDFGLGE